MQRDPRKVRLTRFYRTLIIEELEMTALLIFRTAVRDQNAETVYMSLESFVEQGWQDLKSRILK